MQILTRFVPIHLRLYVSLDMNLWKILTLILLVGAAHSGFAQNQSTSGQEWQSPPEEILKVLNAPNLPQVYTSPTGEYLLLLDPIIYPSLEEMAGPMHKLAGMRVDPRTNYYHGRHGSVGPRLVRIEDGKTTELDFPNDKEVVGVRWTVDGQQFAMMVKYSDHIGLWTGNVQGEMKRMKDIAINPLIASGVNWMPDQKRLLIRRIPDRGPAPAAPAIPAGPKVVEGIGASARSTYEARNLLETVHDDQLFEYYGTCEMVVLDPQTGAMQVLGSPAVYGSTSFSPDGKYILTQYMKGPWSHEVAYWRFGKEIEVWDTEGKKVATIASLPLADAVPVQGVPEGPRSVSWQPTAPHTLFWIEALDGGNPTAKVEHRDRLMSLEAPFSGEAKEIFKAEHRILSFGSWFQEGSQLLLYQRERIKRRRYAWILDIEKGTSRKWFDLDEADRYNAPGYPLSEAMDNGYYVLRERDGALYFRGAGGTNDGDRPFLDLRPLDSDQATRLFRCDPERYESFIAFAGDEDQFVLRSESPTDVPNYYLATIGKKIKKPTEGEGTRVISTTPITQFEDPTPQLRQIEKRLVRYERKDGVPLSFQLHLPPGYKEGTRLPTVVYAYPLEYSGAAMAGQVRGSTRRFMRIYGASHLYFLLQGYAVLDQTAMPMVGDPETTYNTFVEQLVDDAEAAVNKAVEMGVADPDRIGIIGHSHGGLMVANLLAHTDLFRAGIARSGSYNKTTQPFGFQSERRSLFDARDVYIQVSPTFFADKVNEPVLIIHGDDDGNPGTLTFQSEVFYEAVRGSGGTARLVLLPYEDHGYRAHETIEHVLWEQMRWFDQYVKNPPQE